MSPPEPSALPSSGADRCPACGEPLAHDQRYCIRCGARRDSLPERIGAALRQLSGPRPDPGEPSLAPPGEPPVAAAEPPEAQAEPPASEAEPPASEAEPPGA